MGVFSVRQDNIILDLDVTPFIVTSRIYSMTFNSVTTRSQTRLNVITVRAKIKLTTIHWFIMKRRIESYKEDLYMSVSDMKDYGVLES